MEVHDSARRHGVADLDILHAVDHAVAIEDTGEDPDRWLIIDPDTAANLLEVVVMITEGNQVAIHAMPTRESMRGCSNHDQATHLRPHQFGTADH